jgi:hypothetical protein
MREVPTFYCTILPQGPHILSHSSAFEKCRTRVRCVMSIISSEEIRQTILTTDTAKVLYLHSVNALEYWYCSYLQLLRTLVAVGSSVLGVFGETRARERDRAGVRAYARSTDSSRQLFTSHHSNSKHNNQQSTIHNPQTNTIHKRKMGRDKPKPKANPKAASPVIIPQTATRKRAQVPDEHEPHKCKALKGDLDEE